MNSTDKMNSLKFKLRYPGMEQVCLFHAHNDGWRGGGSPSCVCEKLADAKERVKGDIVLALRDQEAAGLRARSLRRELTRLSLRIPA